MITVKIAAAIREAALKAAQDTAAEHKVEITHSDANFTSGYLRINITATAYDEYGQRGDARAKFADVASGLGLDARHYGVQFKANGELYRIVKAQRSGVVTCIGESRTVNMSAGQVILALRAQGLDYE